MKKTSKILILLIIISLLLVSCTTTKSTNISTTPTITTIFGQIVTTSTNQTSTSSEQITTVIPTPIESQPPQLSVIEQLLSKVNSEQVLLVQVEDDSNLYATISFYEKIDEQWLTILDNEKATVGKNGIDKVEEGDFKTPTGIFTLGSAFGYEENIDTTYPFLELKSTHHWVDDVLSIYYNQLVNYQTGNYKEFNSSEQLVTFDVYEYGVFIDYNLRNVSGSGSAIFLHIFRSESSPTGGCVAVSKENLQLIISKLNTQKNPIIIIGDEDDYLQMATNTLNQPNRLIEEFVYLKEIIPDVLIDAKYYTDDNFLGRQVVGYEDNTAIMLLEAAYALKNVQQTLLENNLSLLVFDAYRPQRAVDDFVTWVNSDELPINKEQFFPDINKNDLIEQGYIASMSSHSKGNTVDLTIIDLLTGQPLDMGSPFDFFGDISHFDTISITTEQVANRQLLRDVMMNEGFSPYSKEWWHFSYNSQQYTNAARYDFIVVY